LYDLFLEVISTAEVRRTAAAAAAAVVVDSGCKLFGSNSHLFKIQHCVLKLTKTDSEQLF